MHFILHACLWCLTRFVLWAFKCCLLRDSLCLILTHLLWRCDSLFQICKQSESITFYSRYWQEKLLTRFVWAEVQGFSKGNIMAYNISGSQWETPSLAYKQIICTWLVLAETTLNVNSRWLTHMVSSLHNSGMIWPTSIVLLDKNVSWKICMSMSGEA